MATLRDTVRRELGAEPPAQHGANQHTGHNNIMSSPKRQGSDPSYLTARLQRDAPALADKVLSGEMSAHAAALAIASEKYHFRT